MDWNDLRLFLALIRAGSVRAASGALGISHSTVARRVDALERRLGVRLFERSTAGYAVTAAGEHLLKAAERIESELHGVERRLIGQDQRLGGDIRVTMVDALATHLLMPHLTRFTETYPGITLEVVMSYDTLDMSRREADVALRFTQAPPEHLVGRRLVTMHMAHYAAADYLSRHPPEDGGACWIGYARHGEFPPWVRESAYPRVPAKGVFGSLLLQFEAARAGMGMAMLPCFLADPDPTLRRLPPGVSQPSRDLWLLTHTDMRTTARLRVFCEFMVETIRGHRELIEGRRPHGV